MTKTRNLPAIAETLTTITRMPEGGSERRGYMPLDRNERTSSLPDWFMEELKRRLESQTLTDYPATDELQVSLAESLGLRSEQVLLTPGADPTIRSLFQVYGRPGERALMLEPTYAMYPVYARSFGVEPLGAGFDMDLKPDLVLLRNSMAEDVRLLLLANPNQPTGTVLTPDDLLPLVTAAEEHGVLVVVDEAYGMFTREPSALELLSESPNLLVVHTWSKAGFAGARIGFVAGDAEVVGNLRKVRSAADVSGLGALCARLLLDHPEIPDQYGAEVRAGAELLSERARELGLEPLPTHANFLLIRLPQPLDPAAVVSALRERQWLIKGSFGTPALHSCIRVTLGPPDLMERFAEVFREVIEDMR